VGGISFDKKRPAESGYAFFTLWKRQNRTGQVPRGECQEVLRFKPFENKMLGNLISRGIFFKDREPFADELIYIDVV
jgi:hypothetical protein